MRYHLHLLFILWISCTLCESTIAQGTDTLKTPVALVLKTKPIGRFSHFYFLPDSAANLPLAKAALFYQQGRFKKEAPKRVFNKGYTGTGAFWFAVTVTNGSGKYRQLYWSVANQVDSAVFFATDSLGRILSADTCRATTPVDERKLKIRRMAFALSLKPGETQTCYLHIFNISRKKWYLPNWMDDILLPAQSIAITLGVHLGVYIFVGIVSLFLFLFFKQDIYAWYTVYIMSFMLFVAIDEHLVIVYLTNKSLISYLYNLSPYPCIIFCLACNIKIMQLLCRQSAANAVMYYPARICFAANIVISSLYVIGPFITPLIGSKGIDSLIYFSVNTVIPVSLLILVCSVIEQAVKRNTTALYYLLAIFCLSFGLLSYYFNYLGITNFVPLTPDGLIVGVTLEVIILSLLIGKDYRRIKSERKELLIQMKNQEIKSAGAMIEVQEAERNRIARDLHDDIGATLSTAKLFLSQVDKQYTIDFPGNAYLKDTITLLEKASVDLRSISHDLLPEGFLETGLFQALKYRLEQLSQKGHMLFNLSWLSGHELPASATTAIAVYRLVNELCVNIIKHANATIGTIQLRVDEDKFYLLVEDNGTGMHPEKEKNGIGLKNIAARVSYLKGELHMDSNPNGTTIMINFPL